MSNQELKPVDMTGYTNKMWFDEMNAYLTLIMTPEDPKPHEKQLTREGKIKQAARVKLMVRAEFLKRFPELLDGELFE
tara:strand:+ start:417 stop:650 length:234 start_codon:yes stop_codon:yes gene_type:complete